MNNLNDLSAPKLSSVYANLFVYLSSNGLAVNYNNNLISNKLSITALEKFRGNNKNTKQLLNINKCVS